MKLRRGMMALVFVLTAGMAAVWMETQAQDRPAVPRVKQTHRDPAAQKSLSLFMRKKLAASDQILEGLALEDLTLVKAGAEALHSMSAAETWRVYNDAVYSQFSSEFQRNSQALIDAAKNDNLDQAALKWFATTMNCIECHRYVRNNLVVAP
ncbi:hypothetical protein [Planctomicrobium piriforme]|uniref:Cytochrome C n=1 Tax=Planctomicrobium piriforme TaxID=1576369 RepID=A0A1I3B5G3_9PLAN|nr:hypothetical protein [Planctomicrobium piriforme]SFH56951.1 hypothetical protein SAMN05421753_101217 [Planctomicrobium piriforme]